MHCEYTHKWQVGNPCVSFLILSWQWGDPCLHSAELSVLAIASLVWLGQGMMKRENGALSEDKYSVFELHS
jgi:hypothetical protein